MQINVVTLSAVYLSRIILQTAKMRLKTIDVNKASNIKDKAG
jgi:hypothetical protein